MANILVYGGSFDPITKGHMAAAHYARSYITEATGERFEIWLVPSFHDTFNQKTSLEENSHHRLEMMKLALKYDYAHVPDVLICTVELDAKNKMGTYEMLSELQRQYPKYNFRFLVGADAAQNIDRWRNSRKLRREFNFVISPRVMRNRSPVTGAERSPRTVNFHYHWAHRYQSPHIILPHAPVSIPMESSMVREFIATGKFKEARKILPTAVYDYIRQNGLYTGDEHVPKFMHKTGHPFPKLRYGGGKVSAG